MQITKLFYSEQFLTGRYHVIRGEFAMKRLLSAIIICIFICTIYSCGTTKEQDTESFEPGTKPAESTGQTAITSSPNLSQIQNICELATLECYFRNVAKSVKEKGTGISHWGEKDRTFWIEYTGIAKIGIDMAKVTMQVDGTNVMITLPEAEILSYKVDEITEASYITSPDSWFNKNPITAEEQTAAVEEAQAEMKSNVENNSALFIRAQDRAKKLIENYITQLGEASGVEYHIIWEYEAATEKTG